MEHVDVLIVGAGLSGIGAACHLTRRRPGTSFVILEARESSGGTWDLFRYPGVRSDSDMYTLGYAFRPWTDPRSIADGDAILRYVRETAAEYGVDDHIRYRHRVVRASWSSVQARWTVEAERTDTGANVTLTCSFLYVCSGYYRYDEGYTPDLPGIADFGGTVVHPQHWPEDLDHTGKRVLVVGSGATAITLVPAMTDRAAHVTMLQRSPGYVLALPATDKLALRLRRRLPPRVTFQIMRWRAILRALLSFQLSRHVPGFMKWVIRRQQMRLLPAGYDIGTHFAPQYDPWDQRLCIAPNGDLFRAIRKGRASIETDRIETFTPTGVRLASGRELEADVVVTATGLNLMTFGGAEIVVDGERVSLPERLTYRGMMLSGVPNHAFTVGYTNASWTLKADLVAEYVCRLLDHMDEHGHAVVVAGPDEPVTDGEPLIDLNSGYVLRALDQLPRQGRAAPWRLYQNYPRDLWLLRRGRIEDGVLRFLPATSSAADGRPGTRTVSR